MAARTIDPVEGGKALLVAVIRQAVADARAGRPCNGSCAPEAGAHACAQDARAFLRGPACTLYLAWFDLDPGEVQAALLAQAEGRPPQRGQPAPRQLGLFAWAGAPPRPRAMGGNRR